MASRVVRWLAVEVLGLFIRTRNYGRTATGREAKFNEAPSLFFDGSGKKKKR